MSICFFGSYDPLYARNKILLDGLRQINITVLHCNSKSGSILTRYPQLLSRFWRIRNQVDIIYVAFVGHLNMPLAWIMGKLFHKKIAFDMFYSMYDTYVFDRKSAQEGSIRAWSYYLIDKLAVLLADVVVIDTNSHGRYIANLLHISNNKFKRVFVGGDDQLFKPKRKKKQQVIRVIFHGMFTRLHGAEFFVRAAKLLEKQKNLKLILVGSTENYPLPIKLYAELNPRNLEYIPQVGVARLAKLITTSDISMGHLGTTKKAQSVITNKMFQALASRVAVIAGDCPANHELFTHGETAWFVKMGDPKDLANAIIHLCHRPKLVSHIAAKGYQLFKNDLTNKHLGLQLIRIIQSSI